NRQQDNGTAGSDNYNPKWGGVVVVKGRCSCRCAPPSQPTDHEQLLVVEKQVASVLEQYLRRIWRASLTPDSLLTIDEASEALPGIDDAAARIERHVAPAVEVPGRAMYRWVDVVAALDRTRSTFPHSEEPAIQGYEAAAALLNTSATTLRRMVRTEGLPPELHPRNKSAGARNRRPWWTSAAECRTWYERFTTWLAVRPPTRKRNSRQRTHAAPSTNGPVDFAAHARKLAEGR
ncbi:MAG: hypothetical protein ABMB14_16215, partial [Myxococcota bacterium]